MLRGPNFLPGFAGSRRVRNCGVRLEKANRTALAICPTEVSKLDTRCRRDLIGLRWTSLIRAWVWGLCVGLELRHGSGKIGELLHQPARHSLNGQAMRPSLGLHLTESLTSDILLEAN